MAKISRSEFLSNIRNILNESMNANTEFDGTEKFGIRRFVSGLVEEGNKNPRLMSYLLKYDKFLNEGTKDFILFNQFGQGLGEFAKGNRSIKSVLEQMNNILASSGNELETFLVIEQITEPYAQKVIKESYNRYIADKCPETMTNLIESLDLLYNVNPDLAAKLNVLITEEQLCTLKPFGNYMNESAFEELSRKMNKDKEDKKLKEIQEKIENYANEIFDNAIKENEEAKQQLTLNAIANSNEIGLNEAIKNIAASDAKINNKLMETLNQYAAALTNGAYEERLYGTFVNNLQKFTYLLPVERAIKVINENVEKRSLPIMITKLLEEMTESMSYYLVPLVEEDCARFVKNPTPTNRVQLRNALVPHAGDPYVYAMLEAIDRDDSKSMNSITEKALSIKDQIKVIRQNASITDLYSPVQYIKENECVFNVNGQFYVKKGNTLSKLDEAYLPQLSEKFIALCQLVNDPRVVIDEDKIIFATNDKVAYIFEGYVDINGVRESRDSLRDLKAMCMKYDFDTDFYITCSCLHENFNNIAKVNFAKHVSLNENRGINLDLFRLGDNIFINTTNEAVSQSTFYRDVNPIQCKNIINSHMGINVSSLFEDLIPSQDKIIMKLNETQNEYESAIAKYEATIEKLEKALDECNSEENQEKLESAIKTAKTKVNELKKEYKEWQKDVKKATTVDSSDDDIDDEEVSGDGEPRKETTNEPLDSSDVEAAMPELSTPLTDSSDDMNLTDDEFASYLNDDSDEDTIHVLDDNSDSEDSFDFNDTVNDDSSDTFDDILLNTAAEDDSDFNSDSDDDEFINNLSLEQDANKEIPTVDNDEEFIDNDEEFTTDNEVEFENSSDETINPDEATDLFGGNVNNPLGDELVDAGEPVGATAASSTYKITNVMFDQNIKTGEKYKAGTVSVIIPMVNSEGSTYIDNKTFTFYINNEGRTILDNEEMTVDLYNAVCDAIKTDASYNDVVKNGIEKTAEGGTYSPYNNEENFDTTEDINIDDNTTLTTTDGSDSWSVSLENDDNSDFDINSIFTMDENNDNSDSSDSLIPVNNTAPVIPVYKDGDTEFELPAPNVDNTVIAESKKSVNESRKRILGITPVYKKNNRSFF